MNISTLLKKTSARLASKSESARLDAEVLLSHLLNKPRTYLYAHPEVCLNPTQLSQFELFVNARLQGTPIAYLTGFKEFWSLSFKVNEHTLIPRADTELLVEILLDKIQAPRIKLLDLGTGSGAISIALAHERPLWQITACDVSDKALEIARDNAKTHATNTIRFIRSHWFEQLGQERFDVIVSNPPYIDACDAHLKEGDVAFEPKSALVSTNQGYADLKYLIDESPNHLNAGGLLLLEHGHTQQETLLKKLTKNHYQHRQAHADLSGMPRAVSAIYPPLWHSGVGPK